ncbi:Hypothetical protein CINCED_3A021494 [Cinara cedri]|uniref:Uncharacterized protein n=1 Tax=Cinara cedri TaxID=506608 RepID=A0A5E4N2J8_9HEMI|nr:Hypothetical protein CINCED_3A021494 [Cinara cedri]
MWKARPTDRWVPDIVHSLNENQLEYMTELREKLVYTNANRLVFGIGKPRLSIKIDAATQTNEQDDAQFVVGLLIRRLLQSYCSIKEGSIIDEDGVYNNSPTSQGTSDTLLPSTGYFIKFIGFLNSVSRTSKKRKYDGSYLEMEFIETNDGQPQCVICSKVFPKSSMYPGKLRRHYEKVHPDHEGKPIDFFKRKRSKLLAIKKKIKTHVQTEIKMYKAIYNNAFEHNTKPESMFTEISLVKIARMARCEILVVYCKLLEFTKNYDAIAEVCLASNNQGNTFKDEIIRDEDTENKELKYTVVGMKCKSCISYAI